MYKKISYFVASLFYVGYVKKMPGTVGSLLSLVIIYLCFIFFNKEFLEGLFIVSYIVAYFTISEVLKYTEHDPQFIVIDEFIGQLIAILAPIEILPIKFPLWIYFILAFLFFRLFDIKKVAFVKWADEKLKNAHGVILDDVFAGLYASCLLYFVIHFFNYVYR